MTSGSIGGAPAQRLEFAYDYMSRRIAKRVYTRSAATICPATSRSLLSACISTTGTANTAWATCATSS